MASNRRRPNSIKLTCPMFVSPGAVPSVACLEWIVCKNQTVSREVRLSDSRSTGRVCSAGWDWSWKQRKSRTKWSLQGQALLCTCTGIAHPGAPRSFLALPGCCETKSNRRERQQGALVMDFCRLRTSWLCPVLQLLFSLPRGSVLMLPVCN